MKDLVALISVFLYLSIFTVGGGLAAYPEMKRQVVDLHHWCSPDELAHLYSIGQLAPGPNMMIIASIGQAVGGLLGAFAVVISFFAPTALFAFWVGRVWKRFDGRHWKSCVAQGLAPISIGLLLSGCLTLASHMDRSTAAGLIAAGVFSSVMWTTVHPALIILLGGCVGALTL